jgi:tRNA (cytidine/uridine-2'-O-)-methyltransferase
MLKIVLVEPEIPPNTGNIIRLCANTGAALHLVQPLGFRLDDKRLKRSGLDYHALAEVRVHADLEACLEALGAVRTHAVETGGGLRYSEARFGPDDAVVFGSETRGLSVAALERLGGLERALHIPMRDAQSRSLNLSNAVAVVVYEAWRQQCFASSVTPFSIRAEAAAGDAPIAARTDGSTDAGHTR